MEDNSCLVFGVMSPVFSGANSIHLLKLDSNFNVLWTLNIEAPDMGLTNMVRSIESPFAKLDLSDLAVGVYLVGYKNGKGSFGRKAVLE